MADNEKKKLNTISRSFPWPSIIRLNNYIHVPYQRIILTRKNIIKRDGHRCAYCGQRDESLTIDHILPKSRGGGDSWENLTACCVRCNNKKGNRTPEEAGMPLRLTPYTPNHIMFILKDAGNVDQAWKPFLFQT